MYCAQCGTALQADAHFCPECGAKVDGNTPQQTAESSIPETVTPAKPGIALWKKIVLGALAVLTLIIFVPLWLTADLDVPIAQQMEALRNGDMDAAYAQTSILFRKTTSRKQFEAFIKAHPYMTEITDYSFSEREIDTAKGTLKGVLKTADGGQVEAEFILVKEGEDWKIQGIHLGSR